MKTITKPTLGEVELHSIATKLAQILFEINSTEVTHLPSQKDSLIFGINRSPLLTEVQKKAIVRYTQSLPFGCKLCHGDFHPGNVIYDGSNYFVIDWSHATAGEPTCDVSRAYYCAKVGPVYGKWNDVQMQELVKRRAIFGEKFIQSYLQLSGNSVSDVVQWDLPIAVNRLYDNLDAKDVQIVLQLISEKTNQLLA
jgi:aminoglycoside phosphotransferase (APT) family kinase protein